METTGSLFSATYYSAKGTLLTSQELVSLDRGLDHHLDHLSEHRSNPEHRQFDTADVLVGRSILGNISDNGQAGRISWPSSS